VESVDCIKGVEHRALGSSSSSPNKSLSEDVSWVFVFTQINWDLTGTSLEHRSACVQRLFHKTVLTFEDLIYKAFHPTVDWKNPLISGQLVEKNC